MAVSWATWCRRRMTASALGITYVWCFPIACVGDSTRAALALTGVAPERAHQQSRWCMLVASACMCAGCAVATARDAQALPSPLPAEVSIHINLSYGACSAVRALLQAGAAATAAIG
eukprot:7651474-Alexandrium_andersonii.AAC.1